MMANLKELIKAETLKLGSAGAMPSNDVITLEDRENFNGPEHYERYYTAPSDGMLNAFLQAPTAQGRIDPGVNISCANGIRFAARTNDGSVWANVRKGDNVAVMYYNAGNPIDQWKVKFVKTIGGGIRRLLRSLVPEFTGRACDA